MTSSPECTGHFRSVYSAERLREISEAIQDWFESLPSPRNKTAKSALGVSQQAVHRWRSGGGPKPIFMARLWDLTQNKAFLLTGQERECWRKRIEDLPNIPTQEEHALAKPKAPPPEPENLIPLATVDGQMVHSLTVLHAVVLGLESLRGLLKNPLNIGLRERAAKLVLRLVRVFDLTVEDFKLGPQEEPDTVRRGAIERVISTVVGIDRRKEP